ncbi:putative peptidase S54, rhomboid domain, Rhomboid-like superfamily [Helianthus annuus]|nr:putative peptidase S54, rhomboid domain, Rhomboid-like superfamily [Helianthus annuus]KAJ0920440.1 putative peptidase S54, rhomboid domain, Rhomboid-like superfamily [Helianthus annuus]
MQVLLDNFNSGRYHTMITSAFSHKDFLHILPNIIALYSYGKRGASDAVMAILMLDTLLTPVNISLGKFTIPAHALLAVNEIFMVYSNM